MSSLSELRHRITDEQWDKIKDLLPGKVSDPGRTATDNRKFIDAVMWIAKTGAPWRDLPESRGEWRNTHKRFLRWSRKGIWQKVFNHLAFYADTEWLMIDGTIVKAHQCSSGALKKRGQPESWS